MTQRDSGLSVCELVAVLALVGIGLAISFPALAEMRASAHTAAGARRLAVVLQALRWRSVAEARAYGLLFRRDAVGWHWHEVRDGNGNGLRTSEVNSGVDQTLAGPHRLESIAHPATLGLPFGKAVPAIPPGKGLLGSPEDPIRFGNTDLIAFGPLGTSSSGTLFVTDGHDRVYGVVLFGRTGRVRVWRYEFGRGVWVS